MKKKVEQYAPSLLKYDIGQLSREEAELLGFATYAELSFATKSAPSVAAAEKMIADLADAAEAIAERENAELKAFKVEKDGKDEELAPWDLPYWTERLREARFDYSEEELSRYFNLPTVLDGLFDLAHRLFGVTVESADWTVPVWQDDVRFFRVRDEKGDVIAHFYFDPYSRPETKSDGAIVTDARTAMWSVRWRTCAATSPCPTRRDVR